jgi:hypothetical protein
VLKSPFLEHDKNKDEIDIASLMLWGLILCAGDAKLKTRVFYDILQDNLQENIAATDKDFPKTFGKLLELATKLPYELLPATDYRESEKRDTSKINDSLYDDMKENFLDTVFDQASKLSRNDYMGLVVEKSGWIFSSKDVRAAVDKKLAS